MFPARQATLPCGSFWRAKLITNDDLGNFLTHVTTFYDLGTTLMTDGDDILMTMKTISEDTLTARTTHGGDTFTTHVATYDHFVTTPNDVTDDPCDNIDNQEQVGGSNMYQGSSWGLYEVTTRTTQ
jgi:hypothetical protein